MILRTVFSFLDLSAFLHHDQTDEIKRCIDKVKVDESDETTCAICDLRQALTLCLVFVFVFFWEKFYSFFVIPFVCFTDAKREQIGPIVDTMIQNKLLPRLSVIAQTSSKETVKVFISSFFVRNSFSFALFQNQASLLIDTLLSQYSLLLNTDHNPNARLVSTLLHLALVCVLFSFCIPLLISFFFCNLYSLSRMGPVRR